jgi:hypothetical protein
LRVLAGTHVHGVMSDAQVLELAKRVPVTTCCAAAGAVVVMRPLIVHASSKVIAEAPRRVLHIEYAPSLDIDGAMKMRLA